MSPHNRLVLACIVDLTGTTGLALTDDPLLDRACAVLIALAFIMLCRSFHRNK